MKRVLVITYYWPPSGGSGVQRVLKFVKYLSDFGWEPVVYTVQNGEYPEIDTSLLKEVPSNVTVIKGSVFEPYSFYKKFSGKKSSEKINPNFFTQKNENWKDRLAIWIRSNFFIPDARMFWVGPSVIRLTTFLIKNPVDAIISSGPPHSTHLIGLNLKKKLDIPWLADFRDPWTNIDFYKNLTLTPWADAKHRKLEKQVLVNANKVIMAGYTWADELSIIGNVPVIPVLNGYDESDFHFDFDVVLDAKFSIVHLGMYSKGRNHEVLWKVLQTLCTDIAGFEDDLELSFYGKYDVSAIEYRDKYNLQKQTHFYEYIPHSEIVKVQARSQVLYLSINNTPNVKGIMTGKVFEYLAVKRPILCIGPKDGDAARILLETEGGLVSEFDDEVELKRNILFLYQQYKNSIQFQGAKGIEKYTRRAMTEKLAGLLDEMLVEKRS